MQPLNPPRSFLYSYDHFQTRQLKLKQTVWSLLRDKSILKSKCDVYFKEIGTVLPAYDKCMIIFKRSNFLQRTKIIGLSQ